MNNKNFILNESMTIIERLAALCATPGIDDTTQKTANSQIQELLNGPIKASVTELKSAAAGIVTLM
jgi:hypothetical protein